MTTPISNSSIQSFYSNHLEKEPDLETVKKAIVIDLSDQIINAGEFIATLAMKCETSSDQKTVQVTKEIKDTKTKIELILHRAKQMENLSAQKNPTLTKNDLEELKNLLGERPSFNPDKTSYNGKEMLEFANDLRVIAEEKTQEIESILEKLTRLAQKKGELINFYKDLVDSWRKMMDYLVNKQTAT